MGPPFLPLLMLTLSGYGRWDCPKEFGEKISSTPQGMRETKDLRLQFLYPKHS